MLAHARHPCSTWSQCQARTIYIFQPARIHSWSLPDVRKVALLSTYSRNAVTGGSAASDAAFSTSQLKEQSSVAATASEPASPVVSVLERDASLLRRILASRSAVEALDLYIQQGDRHKQPHAFTAADGELLLKRSLQSGNTTLAMSIYEQMCIARRAQGRAGASSVSAWPAATLQHTETLVMGLCQQLQVADALATVSSVRSQGMQGAEEVSFGHVVNSPLPPQRPLAVVQPQEGCKVVSDSNSRYEFELFSGSVTSCRSEALQPSSNPFVAAARMVGLWRRSAVAAVHEIVVQAPDGSSRTFRIGTATADVPAQMGDRVTVVCAPNRGRNKLKRVILSTNPPGTQPGEAMLVCNHKTGIELQLLRPPVSGSQTTIPGWLVPAAVVLAGGDAASGLLDPALPVLISGGLAVAVGSAVAGNTLLLPKLKQLPSNAVKIESIRQQLLAQHAGLNSKVQATMQEASDDVRTLARLWQLQQKMQSVDSSASSYEARIGRVAAAVAGIEKRLSKRLELLDGYARVMNMIEIEVEMDMQVPLAELDGLGVELEKLSELESIREEWQMQAEAQDEVERLLRQSPAVPLQ